MRSICWFTEDARNRGRPHALRLSGKTRLFLLVGAFLVLLTACKADPRRGDYVPEAEAEQEFSYLGIGLLAKIPQDKVLPRDHPDRDILVECVADGFHEGLAYYFRPGYLPTVEYIRDNMELAPDVELKKRIWRTGEEQPLETYTIKADLVYVPFATDDRNWLIAYVLEESGMT